MSGSVHTIGILEDDPHFRGCLETLVADAPDLVCAFSVGTLAEALHAYRLAPPALCLVDLGLPDGHGTELIVEASRRDSSRVLVLSVLGDRGNVMEALRAGAHGYVLKDDRPAHILESLRQTLSGYSPISPQIAVYLTRLLVDTSPASTDDLAVALTEREAQVLSVFARGLSYRDAARVLGISPHTVSDYVKKIYRKLNVHSRSEAVFEAQSMGLLDHNPGGLMAREE